MGNGLVQAGKLDRRVTIERASVTADAHNEEVKSWGDVATRWASARPAPGFERFQNAETASQALMRFVFRWEQDLVLVTDRLRLDGRSYDVAAPPTEIGRREGLEVLASARGE